jgi:hypothetical protein
VLKTHADGGGTFQRAGTATKPARTARAKAAAATKLPKLSPEQLDCAYHALIGKLKLSEPHRNALRSRGLADEQIDRREYRSMPSADTRKKIAAVLADELGDEFAAVPGFGFTDEYRLPFVFGTAGMLVPIRNGRGQIIGMLIRADSKSASAKYTALSSNKLGGNSPGAPAHVPLGVSGPVDAVRVVEGHLKADVVMALDKSIPTISCGGVTMYRRGIEQASELGAKTIRWAFDADAPRKDEVATALLAAVRATLKDGLNVELERWPEEYGKGLDDVLQNGKQPELLMGEAAVEAAIAIAKAAGVDPGAALASGDELLDRVREALAEGDFPKFFQNKDLLNAIADKAPTDQPLFAAIRTLARQLGVPMKDFNDALKKLIKQAAARNPPELARDESGGFFNEDGCICRTRLTADGPLTIQMNNFTCRIVDETVRDDGAERQIVLGIEGMLANGRVLPRTEVAADKFQELKWIGPAWGSDPIVWPGEGRALPAAIQALSRDDQKDNPKPKVRRTKYTHAGWRFVGGRWAYLHAGGMITGSTNDGDRNTSVDLAPPLSDLRLPDPPSGDALVAAVGASLRMLTVAPERVTFPLLAAVYRSVLGSCDFGVSLVGPSGQGKSELAALCQQHFGAAFDRRHLPASWSSTANSNERLAFLAKDCLLVIDDFAPGGSKHEVDRYHKDAERVFRAQGNNAGRGRMRHDGTLRPPNPPRGLILSTGEDLARGQSIRARQLIIEVGVGDVDFDMLTPQQHAAAAGMHAAAMSGFLSWLTPKYDAVREKMKIDIPKLREEATSSGQHARTPGIIAELAFGFRLFLKFAQVIGAITIEQRDNLRLQCWASLLAAADEQETHQKASDPARQFMRLLSSALATGRVHLADADRDGPPENHELFGWRRESQGGELRPQGKLVGWIRGEYALLDPEAVHAEVQRFAGEQGLTISLSEHSLRKMFHKHGLLAITEQQRGTLTVRRTIHGTLRPVLCMLVDVVSTGAKKLPFPPAGQHSDNGATGYDWQVADSRPASTHDSPANRCELPSQQPVACEHNGNTSWPVNGHALAGGTSNLPTHPTTENAENTEQNSATVRNGGFSEGAEAKQDFEEHDTYVF